MESQWKKWKKYSRKKFLAQMKKKGLDVKIINNPLVLDELTRLRDRKTHNFYFKKGLIRMGELLTYELLKNAKMERVSIETPLAKMQGRKIKDKYVVVPVLRAGLPIAEGFISMIKEAEAGIISCWRELDLSVEVEYAKVPRLEGKRVIVIDPMLATGHTMCAVHDALLEYGKPKDWTILSVVAVPAGIMELTKTYPRGTKVYVCALDDKVYKSGFLSLGLNSHGYIVPGLGDAGDRIYGSPLEK